MREKFEDDYIKNCPQKFPNGFLNRIRKEIIEEDKTIIYNKGGWSGFCYACRQNVRAVSINQRFQNYRTLSCPNCQRKVVCYLKGGAAWKCNKVCNVVCAQTDKNGILWFRMFHVMRDDACKYKKISDYLEECARYAFKPGASAYWQHYRKYSRIYGSYEVKLVDWIRNKRFDIYDGFYTFFPGADNFFESTCLKYFSADKYLYAAKKGLVSDDVIKYAHLCVRYPVMEFLIKKGFYNLISERIRGGKEINTALYWQRKKLKNVFRFPLSWLNELSPEQWNLRCLVRANELVKTFPLQKLNSEILIAPYSTTHLLCALRYMSFKKYKNILLKQNYDERMYYDYLCECEKLKLNLKSNEILFPKNLQAAHERTSQMVDYEENKELYEKFQNRVRSLKKNQYQNSNFLIRPAATAQELKIEGEKLHHCVGGYIRRVAEGYTAIYFIRKTLEPDNPFFTLELKNKEVVQCRTAHNLSYNTVPEVREFVSEWLAKVIRKSA